MRSRKALDALQHVRDRETETAGRRLTEHQNKLLHVQQQLDKLSAYRAEYRQFPVSVAVANPSVYRDRQLFLDRVDDSIIRVERVLDELQREERLLLRRLRDSAQKSQAIKRAIEQFQLDQRRARDLLEQAQCDEQGRIATHFYRPSNTSN